MPLSNVEIWAELGAGRLIIDPPTYDRVDSSSIDLILHEEIIVLPDVAQAQGVTIDPSNADLQLMALINQFGDPKTITEASPYRITPQRMVIGKVHEWIKLPSHLSARIEG